MGEANQDRQMEDLLRTDFSAKDRSKEIIRERLLLRIHNQKGEREERRGASRLKRTIPQRLLRPVFIVVLTMMFLGGFAMTSYAQNLYKAVKEIFVGNYAKYMVSEETGTQRMPNHAGDETLPKGQKTDIADLEKAKSYLAFRFLLPSYLPEGYSFDRMELFKDEQGRLPKGSEYANVYFSNGDTDQDIFLQLRLMNETTAFEVDLEGAKEIKINSHEAVIGNGKVAVEIDGVLYMFNARGSGISGAQLLKMAESL